MTSNGISKLNITNIINFIAKYKFKMFESKIFTLTQNKFLLKKKS